MPRAHSAQGKKSEKAGGAKSGAATTTDHDEIRQWVEDRGGTPAKVADTDGRKGSGILRIDFGEPDESLAPIEWDEFFQIFDDRDLAFLHEETTADGDQSYFNKFVSRGD
jgi:hypothetical protein